jgi:hypothetical protein
MKSFGKQHSCPTSTQILGCVTGAIAPAARLSIEQHAEVCDFCGAEMQMLAKHSTVRAHRRPARRRAVINFVRFLPVTKAPVVPEAYAA